MCYFDNRFEMSNEPLNFTTPMYPPPGYKPLNCIYPNVKESDKKPLLGNDEEFPKIPVEPAVPMPKRELWIQSGVETESCKRFTEQLRQELIQAGYLKAENESNKTSEDVTE